jgi:predicted nucleic acid-binding protein
VVRIIEGLPQAAAFQQAVLDAELVLAPELMLTEVSNALWRLQRAGQLQAESLQQCLSRAAALVDHIEPDRHLQVEALALACHLDHPVYDCLYLALARREAAVLLTADQKLMALSTQVLP